MEYFLAVALLTLVSSAHAVTPAHYSCSPSDVSRSLVILQNGDQELRVSDNIDSSHMDKMSFLNLYGGDDQEIGYYAYRTALLEQGLIDKSVHAVIIPNSMRGLKAKNAVIRLVSYNNIKDALGKASHVNYDHVVKTKTANCKLVPLK